MYRAFGIPLAIVLAVASLGVGQEPQDGSSAKRPPPAEAAPDVAKSAGEKVPEKKAAEKKAPEKKAPEKKAAGEKSPEKKAPEKKASDVAKSAVAKAAEKKASEKKASEKKAGGVEAGLREEHVIYLPYEKLGDVFEDEDSSIMLPYSEFLEMWNRLVEPEPAAAEPPVNGVLTRAEYVGSVKGELAYLEATLDVEVLSSEWARLPVAFGEAAIGSAESDDGSVLLRGVGEGRYELLVRGQGKHRITLSLVIGVKSATEGRSFVVACPAVGVSKLELEIPETDLSVQVSPRQTSELDTGSAETTRVRAVLGSTNEFTVSWQPKSGSSDSAAGLANVSDTIAVDVGDGVVHTSAVFDYQILRGSLGELVVEVPVDQRLLDVQVPGLRDWQSEEVGDRQRVTVRLHAPASEKVRLELHTEAPISEEAFQVGAVRAVGVARESGTLAVRSALDVGLENVVRESITRIDAGDAPESLKRPGSTFYKFFTSDHKLLVVASQLTPRIIVDSHLSVLLDKTRLTTRGEFGYSVSRSGIFSAAFRLPSGFRVDDVRTEAMERFEVTSTAGEERLTVYFTKKLLGDLTISITASQSRDKAAGELALPLLEPLHTTREQGLVAVIAPESLEVKTDSAKLQSARAATPEELGVKGFRPAAPGGSALAAAFSFVTRPVGIVQTITERPRRTLVSVGTVAHVREDVVQVSSTVRYQIQFAGTDTFRLAVPADVSDRLQVSGEGIKERRKADAADGDTVEWTIVLHSEALGERALTATYDQQISIPEAGTQFELRPIEVLDADRQTGEIAIQKDRALSVEATPRGLEEIDPRELSEPIGTAQPYLTYRYYQHPAKLVLDVTKHELQDVVETVVRRAYIEAVVTEEGPITMRARYDLKSSERQRLAVTLREPEILGITVAGQSVAPEKAPAASGGDPAEKTYFINVARAADSEEPFEIRAVFETPLSGKKLGVTDRLRLAIPRFDAGVKFQKVYVRVWVPEDFRLVGNPEGFVSHIGVGLWNSREITSAPDNPDNWFSDDTSSFDFQVGGTTYLFSSLTGPAELATVYWHIPTMTLIASLLVLVLGIGLIWFSLETKVFTILALGFLVLFAGLFSPSVVNSWLLAARLGIAGVIVCWLVVWLLFVRRSGWASSARVRTAGIGPIAAGTEKGSPFEPASEPPPTAETTGAPPPESEAASDGEADEKVDDKAGESGRGQDEK